MNTSKEQKKNRTLKYGNPINLAGRPKGSKNKFTTDLQQFCFDILNSEKMGGLEGAINLFSKNDRNKIIFFQMIAKMLPSNLNAKVNGTITTIQVISAVPRPEEKI